MWKRVAKVTLFLSIAGLLIGSFWWIKFYNLSADSVGMPASLRSYILTENSVPTPNLLKLLQVLDVEHENSLASIVKSAQKSWLRVAGSERWHVTDDYNDQRKQLLPLLKNLGLVDEVKPIKKQ